MKHTHSYIICATPRSGSTLLCDLLTDTGICGRPNSFFTRRFVHYWARELNLSVAQWNNEHEFDQSYLCAVLQRGADGTRVFGMRLMWESVVELSKRLESFYPDRSNDNARFCSAFGSPCYLHLTRADKVAQAVSLLRAEQSGLWHVFADGSERERHKSGQVPIYDASLLSELVAMLEEHDAAWLEWFSLQDIEPLRITYEALSCEPKDVMATVLSFIGLDSGVAGAAEPKTAKLADSENHEWAARFRQERASYESST
jgi:LPS sulfotransferase NodH